MEISVHVLDEATLSELAGAYRGSVWSPDEAYFRGLLALQEKGARDVMVGWVGDEIAGHVTIKWQSDYPHFAQAGIPEINDLRVLERFRRQGVATRLVDEAERRIFRRAPAVGIGFGLYSDYGAAQKMYVRRGYIPDGHGLYCGTRPVLPGTDVRVDNDLVLYLVKVRP